MVKHLLQTAQDRKQELPSITVVRLYLGGVVRGHYNAMQIIGAMSEGTIDRIAAVAIHEVLGLVSGYFAELGFVDGNRSDGRRHSVWDRVNPAAELLLAMSEMAFIVEGAVTFGCEMAAQGCLITLFVWIHYYSNNSKYYNNNISCSKNSPIRPS